MVIVNFLILWLFAFIQAQVIIYGRNVLKKRGRSAEALGEKLENEQNKINTVDQTSQTHLFKQKDHKNSEIKQNPAKRCQTSVPGVLRPGNRLVAQNASECNGFRRKQSLFRGR